MWGYGDWLKEETSFVSFFIFAGICLFFAITDIVESIRIYLLSCSHERYEAESAIRPKI